MSESDQRDRKAGGGTGGRRRGKANADPQDKRRNYSGAEGERNPFQRRKRISHDVQPEGRSQKTESERQPGYGEKREARPFTGQGKSFTPRSNRASDTERKPFRPRGENRSEDQENKTWPKREKSYRQDDSRPSSGRKTSGSSAGKPYADERKPYRKTDDSPGARKFQERKPYGESTRKPFSAPKTDEAGSERKPARKGSYSSSTDRPDRKDRADRPSTPRSFDKRKNTSRDSFSKKRSSAPENTDGLIRLNKFLADAGVCSRREADVLISAGTVTVNGEVVTELGRKVNILDKVNYGGQTLNRETLRYVLLNKPKGYITTSDDPFDRKTVMELVTSACHERIYPVGRLDRNTTGLLLLTNDGELAKKLMHPRHGVSKLYHVELDKAINKPDIVKIADGIELEDGRAEVDEIAWVAGADSKKEVGIQIHSGKNRIVRRIFESLGYQVVKLDRVIFAGLTKHNLPRGKWRHLLPREISQLKSIK